MQRVILFVCGVGASDCGVGVTVLKKERVGKNEIFPFALSLRATTACLRTETVGEYIGEIS